MGKSTLSAQCRFLGIPVHDADQTVHALMQPEGAAYDKVAVQFPQALKNNMIDRKALGHIVFHDTVQRKRLESILHPLVRHSADLFITHCRRRQMPICVLDIPLLFETGRDQDMDETLCVTAPSWVQERRVLSRPGMTKDRFNAILNMQMSDAEKRRRSDHIIQTGLGRRHALNQLKRLL